MMCEGHFLDKETWKEGCLAATMKNLLVQANAKTSNARQWTHNGFNEVESALRVCPSVHKQAIIMEVQAARQSQWNAGPASSLLLVTGGGSGGNGDRMDSC